MTLGGMMSGIGNIANISMRAFSLIDFLDPGGVNEESDRFGLFDALISISIKSVFASSMTGPIGIGKQLQASVSNGSSPLPPTTPHHTVPIYMCGKDQRSNLANIPRSDHRSMHGQLDKIHIAVKVAAQIIDLSLRRGGPKQKYLSRPVMTRVARTTQGRSVLAAALGVFYAHGGYWGLNDGRGGLSLGEVFSIEAPKYIASRASTSWPKCKR